MIRKLKLCSTITRANNLQYISDLHVDTRSIGRIPKIYPVSDHLVVCGDIGNPKHPNFHSFISKISSQFKKIFIVPGNHDMCCGFHQLDKVNYNQYLINEIIKNFTNVYYLNQSIHQLDHNYLIAGTILWSQPIITNNHMHNYLIGLNEHNRQVQWIEKILKDYDSSNIIMATHYLPSFQLIEEKYLKRGIQATSRFATDLEYLIKPPIYAWLCGHSHSVINKKINGIYCGINAYGYKNEKDLEVAKIKIIELM